MNVLLIDCQSCFVPSRSNIDDKSLVLSCTIMSCVSYLYRRLRRKARRSRIMTLLIPLTVMCIVISPFYVIYKPPTFLVRYFQRRWPDVLWRIPTSTKVIALTIDEYVFPECFFPHHPFFLTSSHVPEVSAGNTDSETLNSGPSEYTQEIMQILKYNSATATFFVIGSQVAGHEEVLQDLIRNGNELGNHAMHDEPSRALSDATLVDQIQSVEEVLHQAYIATEGEPPPKYFRPGSGVFSGRMRKMLGKLGYRLVLGSIYPHDPQIPFWRINASHILSMLRPGGIIICHDRRKWTAPMLGNVLPEIRRRGYRIVTVTELLKEENT